MQKYTKRNHILTCVLNSKKKTCNINLDSSTYKQKFVKQTSRRLLYIDMIKKTKKTKAKMAEK